MSNCPFCRENWDAIAEVIEFDGDCLIFTPLNPVVEGHVLVVCGEHSSSAPDSPDLAALAMVSAARYVRRKGIQANIITSVGPAATQTVRHTHLHVVPRTEDDGLKLPWSDQER